MSKWHPKGQQERLLPVDQQKRKTRENMGPALNETGDLWQCEETEVLNGIFFALVFTGETSGIPGCWSQWGSLEQGRLHYWWRRIRLENTWTNWTHARLCVQKEWSNVVVRPLSAFEKLWQLGEIPEDWRIQMSLMSAWMKEGGSRDLQDSWPHLYPWKLMEQIILETISKQ